MNIFILIICILFSSITIVMFIRLLKHFKYKNAFKTMYYNLKREYKIPKICHQTWNTIDLCPEIKQIMEKNKLNNPDIEFKLHIDKDSYIKNNFDEITYTAFKKINPKYGAALADFFRYCVLYNEGGIYLDIKSSLNTKLFDNIIKEDDICILDKQSFSAENWRDELGYGTYEQWLLIFCKGHLYLKNMINLMVEALHSGIEPTTFNLPVFSATRTKERVLRLTGPDAFAVAIHKSIIFNGIMHREISYNSIATLNPGNINKKIYDKYNLIHYSELTEPIII